MRANRVSHTDVTVSGTVVLEGIRIVPNQAEGAVAVMVLEAGGKHILGTGNQHPFSVQREEIGALPHFPENTDQSIDYGIDFYAAQTVLTPDGRRVMIGWMQNWDTCSYRRKPSHIFPNRFRLAANTFT